jgi:elongation factor P
VAGTSDIRNGLVIRYDGQLYKVVDFQHFKMGRGGAKVRTKLKSIPDGNVIEETFRPNDKFEDVRLEARRMQYLYRDGDAYVFMDTDNYEQKNIPKEICDEASKFIKENEEVKVLFDGTTPVDIKLPVKVDLEVVKAPPGVVGNTAQGGDKPVTLETGYKVKVPLFIEEGDIVRVDTRTGEYKERVNT